MLRSSSLLPRHTPHRFLVLDAMRGLAAFCVLCFHSAQLLGRLVFPRGYLAVDFFFLLSGFVISYAYGRKLDAGMTTASFLKARFARLYPMYALGLVLGLIAFALRLHAHLTQITPHKFILQLLAGLVMFPVFTTNTFAFPFNFPTWSLFGEVVANIVHALILRRRSSRTIQLLLLVFGILLAASLSIVALWTSAP